MQSRAILSVLLLAVLAFPSAAHAQDDAANGGPVQSLRATITGNQEQPKVLYIVPWKAAYEHAAVPLKPISGQTEKVFRHMERHEHQRHVEFLQEFSAASGDVNPRP